ncbi:MAG: protein kinase [Bryobacterales bacterium]|nr:protein kinase [Bryobacterales bacterium]
MTPDRFQQIERLFHAALDQPESARAAFLEAACAGDAELRRELFALLESEGKAETEIGSLVRGMAADLDEDLPESEIGRQIGSYTLVKEIGRGGMGVVYQALRSDGEFFQTVALKLVKRGMDTGYIVQRFRAERQILATLNHPNIASLLDGGTSSDGRPYFVMEFIEGEPLMEYCASRNLPIQKRLEMFQAICAAVDHAHQRKVVHRDLKPGNILVTRDGVPKLLDFGIAKFYATELLPEGMPATTGAYRMLTPEYASPEQIRGERPTAATDVYSLGAVLFELLTGVRAKAASTAGVPRASAAGLDRQLRAELEGNLDNIVRKAMQAEPAQRYESAEALAKDIARHLANEAIEAPTGGTATRAGNVFRHGTALAAGAIGAILIAAWLASSWYLDHRRPLAALSDPTLMQGYLRAHDLMAQDPRWKDWPGGMPPQFQEAIELLQSVTGREPRYGPAWAQLAEVYSYGVEFDRTNAAEWRKKARAAALTATRVDPYQPLPYLTLGTIALYDEWDFVAAEKHLKRAVELDPRNGEAFRYYADLLRITGRSEQARIEVDHALALEPNSARLRLQRAVMLYDLGQCDIAAEQATRAEELRPRFLEAMWLKGLCLEREGKFSAAERQFLAILAIAPADGRALPAIGHLYGRMRRMEDARHALTQLEQLQAKGKVVSYSLALVHAGMENSARALDELERAYRERDQSVLYLGIEWRLRDLRAEPRFLALLRQLRLRK